MQKQGIAIILSLLLLTSCGDSFDKDLPKVGLAVYAIQQETFPCDSFLDVVKANNNEVSISFLWKTFGENTTCLDRTLSLPDVTSFLVFGMNAVCQRNQNCDTFEPLSGISVRLEQELLDQRERWFVDAITNHFNGIEQLAQRFPDKKCFVAPELEGNINDESFIRLKNIIEPLVPSCEIVHNPVSNSTSLDGQLTEFHHAPVRLPCFFSNDGISVMWPDISSSWVSLYPSIQDLENQLANARVCRASYLWHHHYNCLGNYFVPPRQRNCNRPEIPIVTDRFYSMMNNLP